MPKLAVWFLAPAVYTAFSYLIPKQTSGDERNDGNLAEANGRLRYSPFACTRYSKWSLLQLKFDALLFNFGNSKDYTRRTVMGNRFS